MIHGRAARFAGIWSKFMCSREFSASLLSRIITDTPQHFYQSHLAIRRCRQYWVLGSEYETQLAYAWQTWSCCWHNIRVLVHQGVLGIYCHDPSITVYLPIPVGNRESIADIQCFCQNLWHGLTYSWQSCWFCWTIFEVPVHQRILGIALWQIQHRLFPNPIWQ